MLQLSFISSCVIYNLLKIPLPFTSWYVAFSINRDIWRYITLAMYTGCIQIAFWETRINFNIGPAFTYDDYERPHHVRRFGIASIHSDHYVRLAHYLAHRWRWIAAYDHLDNDGGTYGIYFGRIKPFGWARGDIERPY